MLHPLNLPTCGVSIEVNGYMRRFYSTMKFRMDQESTHPYAGKIVRLITVGQYETCPGKGSTSGVCVTLESLLIGRSYYSISNTKTVSWDMISPVV